MTGPTSLPTTQTTLHAAQCQWMASFAQGQIAQLAALYSEDGQLLPAYSATISGRAAIQAFWQGCFDMGIHRVQRTPLEVDCLTNTAHEVGEYRFCNRHGRVLDIGKYVVIWKAQQGEWQIQHDIWTSNLPSR